MQPDSTIEPDGPAPGLGISVTWNADPALPGSVTDKVIVTDASFQVDHLQLLSDAGADGRTTRSSYQLQWSSDASPPPEMFPDAPVAVYQRISLDIRPGFRTQYAYQIQGTWRNPNGETQEFTITDTMGLSIPIDCSVALHAGSKSSIAIRVDLQNALNSVDFTQVSEHDGMLFLDSGAQLTTFHDQMTHAFKLDD